MGHPDHARGLIRPMAFYEQVQAQAELAVALAGFGDYDQAEAVVRSIDSSGDCRQIFEHAMGWTGIAWLVAAAGQRSRAEKLSREAELMGPALRTMPYLQAQLLIDLARVAAATDNVPRAMMLANRAEELARPLNEPGWSSWVLQVLPVVFLVDRVRALSLVQSLPDTYIQSLAMAGLAVMTQASGEPADELVGLIGDVDRRSHVQSALATIGSGLSTTLFWRVRALSSLAELVAVSGGRRGMYHWAGPLVYSKDPADHTRMFAALTNTTGNYATALFDRAEAIVQEIPYAEEQPSALTQLAWMIAGAGGHGQAERLAAAVEALTLMNRQSWTLAALMPAEVGDALPDLTGTSKQCRWAESLRAAFIKRRWGTTPPPDARILLTQLVGSRWWIDNKDRLEDAFAEEANPKDDLIALTGTPKQREWAGRLRTSLIQRHWPHERPNEVLMALAEVTTAQWWIEHRDDLDKAFIAEVESHRAVADWYQRLPALPDVAMDGPLPFQRVWLMGLSVSCWRCRGTTTALVGLLPSSSRTSVDLIRCEEEAVLRLADRALPGDARQARQVGKVKPRYSRTVGHAYLSNGCFHCDAIVGNFPLYHKELIFRLQEGGLGGLVEIALTAMPQKVIASLMAYNFG